MRITELTYSRGETRQVRAYEPVNIHCSIKAEVTEGEDLHKAYAELQKIVDEEVELKLSIFDTRTAGKIVREAAKHVNEPF